MGKLSLKNLKRKPFILITSILATVGWAVSFGGACMLKVLNGAWWVIIYQFCIIMGHIMVFSAGSILQYKTAMMTFLASSIPLLTIQVDYVIQYNKPSIPKLPATIYVSGYITLLIVQYLWILVLGSDPKTTLGKLGYTAEINEIGIDHEIGYYSEKLSASKQLYYAAGRTSSTNKIPNPLNSATSVNSIPVLQKPPGPIKYTEKAKAIHKYVADASDPNELGFEKGDIFEVAGRTGNWWLARNSEGATGIIPSNYMQ